MVKERFSTCYSRLPKRIGVVLLIVAASLSLTGCITFLTQINVKGDGSGTMVQTITMNPEQIKEAMEGIAKQMGATTTQPKEDPKNKSSKPSGKGTFKESEFMVQGPQSAKRSTFVPPSR